MNTQDSAMLGDGADLESLVAERKPMPQRQQPTTAQANPPVDLVDKDPDTTTAVERSPTIRLLRRGDLDHVDYPRWVVEGVLPADAVSMVYGRSGVGKSFWALDLAACIATGRLWHGCAVRQGQVVYVAGEGTSGYKARLEAWEQHYRLRADAFSLWPAPVRLWPRPNTYTHSPNSVQAFLEGVNAVGVQPILVVLDTLGTCLGGANENDNGQMRELLDSAEDIRRTWGAAVLLIHHTSKQPDSHTPRGAQSLADGVAMHAFLQGDGKTCGTLTCTKQKDAEPFAPIRRSLHTVKLGKGTASLCFADDYATGPRDKTKRRVPWAALRQLLQNRDVLMTPKDIADALGMKPGAAYQHLARAGARREVYQPERNGAYALVPSSSSLRATTPLSLSGPLAADPSDEGVDGDDSDDGEGGDDVDAA